jgi:hypothetical protein
MSIGRKKALERLESLVPRAQEHLAKIAAQPENPAVDHWKTAVRSWLAQMEAVVVHWARRRGSWETIARLRDELEVENGNGE